MDGRPEGMHGVTVAMDAALLRASERFANHAVAETRHVIYMVTGRMPDVVAL